MCQKGKGSTFMANFKIVYTDNVFGNNLIEKRRYKDVAFKYEDTIERLNKTRVESQELTG